MLDLQLTYSGTHNGTCSLEGGTVTVRVGEAVTIRYEKGDLSESVMCSGTKSKPYVTIRQDNPDTPTGDEDNLLDQAPTSLLKLIDANITTDGPTQGANRVRNCLENLEAGLYTQGLPPRKKTVVNTETEYGPLAIEMKLGERRRIDGEEVANSIGITVYVNEEEIGAYAVSIRQEDRLPLGPDPGSYSTDPEGTAFRALAYEDMITGTIEKLPISDLEEQSVNAEGLAEAIHNTLASDLKERLRQSLPDRERPKKPARTLPPPEP